MYRINPTKMWDCVCADHDGNERGPSVEGLLLCQKFMAFSSVSVCCVQSYSVRVTFR